MCLDTVGRVLASDGGTARVDFDGTQRSISLVLLQAEGVAIAPGDWLRTHTGLAVEQLDPTDAMAMVAEARAMRRSEVDR